MRTTRKSLNRPDARLGGLDRRQLLLASAGTFMGLILPGSESRAEAESPRVPPTDSRLLNTTESFRTRRGSASGYLTRPAGAGPPRPGILLVHGNEGLTPHYRDVARRMAIEGFVVLAPDFLSLSGGTPDDPVSAQARLERVSREEALALATGALDFLVARRYTVRRTGVVGFDWGGALALEFATTTSDVHAVVAYDGELLDPDRASRLRAPVTLHRSTEAEEVGTPLSQLVEAFEADRVNHEVHFYEEVQPGFHDDSQEDRHDPDAAQRAWDRTLAFLTQSLA
jgi:carboxymethylenebutenolidase